MTISSTQVVAASGLLNGTGLKVSPDMLTAFANFDAKPIVTVINNMFLGNTANTVYTNTVGRKISDAELKNITDQLNTLEKTRATKTVSTPTGAGTTTTTTTGGVDEQQFIKEQAMKLPEYQRMQNMNFASWLNQAMSGGQAANLANG